MDKEQVKQKLASSSNMIDDMIYGSMLALREAFAYLDLLKESGEVEQVLEQQKIINELLQTISGHIHGKGK